ncbi:hypothetical protein OSB04_011926 [Centaurea solstitialis]|uniref:TRF2/HOY1 PH-like domain-containing protein n=1 Tax=Centaurea solstitialis TaxID=347529 RepID=A0AA38WE49_9ASTR|nr:hypothetical protein OSB04_011926 [Centaurea solstitialis]
MEGKRNQDHRYSGNYNEEQHRNQNPNNVSVNFHNGYSSSSHDHVHLHQSSSNNLLDDSRHTHHQFPANGIILDPQAGGPIGLRIMNSPSLTKEVEFLMNKEKQVERNQEQIMKKWKATNVPAVFLKIGSWEWVSKNEGDLVAKFYYGRKKLVWEFLYGGLKKKIEIQWPQISAINAIMREGKRGVLKIELKERPEFGQEKGPEAGKHTKWEDSPDFTKDEAATNCRQHMVEFLPGALNESFEKLLQSDTRLFNLSRQPFPTRGSPFFCNQVLDFSNNRSVVHKPSSVPEVSMYGQEEKFLPHVQNLVQPTTSLVHHCNSNLHMPDLEFSDPDELPMGASFKNQIIEGILEQDGNNTQVQETPFPPINGDQQNPILLPTNGDDQDLWIPDPELQNFTNTLSWIQDLPLQELHITSTQNPNPTHPFSNEYNDFPVESTCCKPIKENHQMNFETRGYGIMDGGDQSHVNGDHFDDYSWKAMKAIIDGSSSSMGHTWIMIFAVLLIMISRDSTTTDFLTWNRVLFHLLVNSAFKISTTVEMG